MPRPRKVVERKASAESRPALGLVCVTHSDECRFRALTRARYLAMDEMQRRAALEEVYWANLWRLDGALSFCSRKWIRLYRVTSALFPMSDEKIGEEVLNGFSALLSSFGRRAKRLGIRVVVHPDDLPWRGERRAETLRYRATHNHGGL